MVGCGRHLDLPDAPHMLLRMMGAAPVVDTPPTPFLAIFDPCHRAGGCFSLLFGGGGCLSPQGGGFIPPLGHGGGYHPFGVVVSPFSVGLSPHWAEGGGEVVTLLRAERYGSSLCNVLWYSN